MSENTAHNGTYTVVGGGAIGGTLAAHLALAGHPVQIVDADASHVAAIQEHGLRIHSPAEELVVHVPASTLDEGLDGLGFVLLAVKSQATAEAMEWIAPRLRADGCVASMQNGLNEATIAEFVGTDRTVIAFVDLFADVMEPGVIKDGGIGTIALGEYSGGTSERVERLASDLSRWGQPIVSDNVEGFLWSKLAFGAMLTATAFIDCDMAEVVSSWKSQMLDLAREVFAISDSLNIELEPFDAFEPDAYREGVPHARTDAAFTALSRWLAGQTKTRSGIWRDINVRNRPTEVPSQYEPVIALAAQRRITTPKLRAMVDIIGELERRETAMGPELMERLASS